MSRINRTALHVLTAAGLVWGTVTAMGFSAGPQASPPAARPDPAAARALDRGPADGDKMQRVLALQVALDRAGFSPGEIDGAPGPNTDRAVAAFEAAGGSMDFGEGTALAVADYTIAAEDVAGPFVEQVPGDMMEKAALPALAYASLLELLGERFHASPKLLLRLNPAARFAEGERIVVPNVEPFVVPAPAAAGNAKAETTANKAAAKRPGGPFVVTVTESTKTLQVANAAGEIVLHAPVSIGSANDPLPVGEWKVNGVGRLPVFNYNPKLFWDANPSHAKAKIAPGPNNPVGVMWIDLNKEHYGIHGTPEPSRIGYTESHGCIRLTNWDVTRLAEFTTPGTKVILR